MVLCAEYFEKNYTLGNLYTSLYNVHPAWFYNNLKINISINASKFAIY